MTELAIQHILGHPLRTAATMGWITWRAITWGGIAIGLTSLAALLMGISLLFIWRKVGEIEEKVTDLSDKVGAVHEKADALHESMKE